ncbi:MULTISPECIES: hypothetical protein [Mesorhizobium]|jgi:hypothetical protein|uniref:Uncharacterized protein n=1 Tax=Rhizobium loti TaxID=381 RepID=A0A8E2WAJ1_RHILI|nr:MULTISPECIES: hypothetical protein [Mesorhizobium]PWJ89764.1 hypothetical protein C8D77_10685 [Mesorhizobium loti]RUX93551.1 hypothetical protein EN993_19050 [Mesorhizobium sp. M7D.F.Ca.US.004.01.2.1]RVA29875.1 hypothetical protein EN935_16035 [Mesorhizobium sp. M7D.F.Ca.US.004.03.1.1]
MNDIRATLLLSVQRALLGAVPHNLRAVTCGWEGTEIKLRFVFDGEIAEETYDDARIAGTEVVADFPAPWTISEDIVRLDHPDSIRPGALALWAYRRKEGLAETGN